MRHKWSIFWLPEIIVVTLFLFIHGSLGANQLLQQQQQQQIGSTGANINNNDNNNKDAPFIAPPANNIKPLIQAALNVAANSPVAAAVSPTINSGSTMINADQPNIVGSQTPAAPGAIPQQPQKAANLIGGQVQLNPKQQTLVSASSNSAIDSLAPGSGSSAALNYGNEDPIIYLDYSSISDEILRKRTANFVYFNANFNQCKNCHRFFNIWKDLAIDIRWWRQVIKLFSINCSDEDNIEMCRRAGVTQFPQVKYYWIMSNSLEQDGQRLRILGKSVHAMRHLIMDKVFDSYSEHNKYLAERSRQSFSSLGKPNLSLLSSSSQGGGNPLTSLISNPLIGQLLAGAGAGAGGGGGGGGGGISSIIGALTGKSGAGASANTGLSLMNSLGGAQGMGQLMNALLGASSMRQRFSAQPLPSNWPEFEPIETMDTLQLIDTLPLDESKGIGALLIMETQEFLYTGLEVMLDLNPYANQTYIARVRDERSQMSKNLTKRDDIQAPALIYVTASREPKLIMTAPKYTNDEDLRRAFVRAFERRQIKYPVKRIWTMPIGANQQQLIGGGGKSSTSSGDSQEDDEILSKINQVYMSDLSNALRASLMEQVFRHTDLSDDQYNALVKYIYTLINYFPFNNDESLKFFKRLHTWLQNQVSPIDISEYKKQFHDIDDILPKREWISCKSLSSTKAIPNKGKGKGMGSLFENPSQLGKMVSNLTRLFRGQQQQASRLKNLFSAFNLNSSPVMLNNNRHSSNNIGNQSTTLPVSNIGNGKQDENSSSPSSSPSLQTPTEKPSGAGGGGGGGGAAAAASDDENPLQRIFKSLSSGSLGSDSSILKLISTALTGGSTKSKDGNNRSKFAREYPCGAWKLAHVMVVNEYIKDSPRKDVKHIVLHSLYQYMLQFYACATCGNRVNDVSSEFKLNLDDHLQEQGDSVMLLWKMHNRVSKRLESELRPGSPTKLQFPSESLCPKCRTPKAQHDLALTTPNWHEKQVLTFLVHHYRPQSLITSNSNSSSDSSSSGAISLLSLIKDGGFIWGWQKRDLLLIVCLIQQAWLFLFASRFRIN